MRLIDADELREHLFVGFDYDRAINDGVPKTEKEILAYWCGWNDALKSVVRFAPTVDPVKHGRWTSSQGLAEVGEVQCSNCKTIYYADDLYNAGETDENGIGQALMPNHCPHCGAKMDEVEHGNNN